MEPRRKSCLDSTRDRVAPDFIERCSPRFWPVKASENHASSLPVNRDKKEMQWGVNREI